jgi:hypothetical protein
MDPQQYYATHSPMTHPGQYAYLFDDLPDDIEALCQIVRGVYLHYMGGSLTSYKIPKKRMSEVDLRSIEAILAQIIALDNRPLTAERPPQKRFVGCCRDSALLLCAMLRHKGIPARIHVGFATYFRVFGEGFHTGHVVTEYWDDAAAHWKLVDPEQSDKHIKVNQIDFDVHDVPRDRFLVAGKAWQLCRDHQADAETFGAAPDDFFRGWWALRHRIFHELAYLNKTELLLWDSWNWMEYNFQPSHADLARLDQVAALTLRDDLDEVQAFYAADERFRPPSEVMSYSPTGKFVQVSI